MRLAISLAVVLAAAVAPRGGCGGNGTPPPYDPCAGKACGATCTLCAPDAKDCVENMIAKACDPNGRCVPETPTLCASECAGKACGERCLWPDLPCLHAIPACLPPVGPGYCDGKGACAEGYPPPPGACAPSPDCAGKACGDSCVACPPGADPATCPAPASPVATACSAQLQCVPVGSFTCGP